MSAQKSAIPTRAAGFTLAEVLLTILMIGLIVAIGLAINFSSTRKRQDLHFTAQQFAIDVQAAVQEARSRSAELQIEISSSGYKLYRDNGTSGTGYQTEDELISERRYKEDVGILGPTDSYPRLPQAWGDPTSSSDIAPAGSGTVWKVTSRGFTQEKAVVFYQPHSSAYTHLCVHIYLTGNSEIVRSEGSNSWVPAPLG
jgi:type II secretory pathway pseudopilin PulG